MSSSQKTAVNPPWSSSGPASAAAPSNVNGACTVGTPAPEPAAHALARRSNVGASKLDATCAIRVAELLQVVERGVDARLDVEPHDRQPARAHLDLDRVLVGARRQLGLEQQQAVGGAGEQRLQRRRLPLAVVADVDQHDRVAGALRRPLGAAQHAPENGLVMSGHHQRDAARDAGPQRARRDVRAVAELRRRGAHRLLRARGDAPGGLAGEHEETVDCDTPARRATSTLVTRGGALIPGMLCGLDDLVEEVVGIGGHDLCLLRPRDAEALLSEEAFEHEEFLPYWAELWPSALALARAVGARALHGARTLELGCGLGLPSLAAALAGGRVLATDWAPDAITMTARNAERNGLKVEVLRCPGPSPRR